MADVLIVPLAVLILMVVFDNTWNTIHSDSTGGNGPLVSARMQQSSVHLCLTS